MGWSGGSELAESVWAMFRKYVPENERRKCARKLISLFEDMDCDTMEECEKLYYEDAGYKEEE